jgi:hypothetical protein
MASGKWTATGRLSRSDSVSGMPLANDTPCGARPLTITRREHQRVPGPFEGRRVSVLPIAIRIHDLSVGGCLIESFHEQAPAVG